MGLCTYPSGIDINSYIENASNGKSTFKTCVGGCDSTIALQLFRSASDSSIIKA